MIENINWYPGHMKKTRELIAENLRLVCAVLEVCDARIPVSSRNPSIDELTRGKPRVIVLNKSDLADEAETRAWLARMTGSKSAGEFVSASAGEFVSAVAMNAVSGHGIKKLFAALERAASLREGAGAVKSRRIMVVGVPNSGKSSLINRLTGRRVAQTGDRPGVTRGKQWLTLENGMQLLDTPGILWHKFEDPRVGMNLAFCGSIKDEIMDIPGLALELIRVLESLYPGALAARYGTAAKTPQDADESNDMDGALHIMEEIARSRGCILPGKRIDYERAGRMILDEFRAGKLGRITLERI
jgi:ribosome biogenesis GTPase A